MITSNNTTSLHGTDWHDGFLKLLPEIENRLQFAFRDRYGEAREEAVQAAVCNCCQAYARLVDQGKAENVTAGTLASYAAKQVKLGRRVGTSLNCMDVGSLHCLLKKGVHMKSLSHWDDSHHQWQDMLVEDNTCTPADLAASRIDYPEFLNTLDQRDRRIAETLSTGETTKNVAKRFGISSGRVSQLRRELKAAWETFHGMSEQVLAAIA